MTRFVTSVGCLAAACAALPSALLAQSDTTRADTTVFRIEGIRVQAERPVTTTGGSSAVEVTVDSLLLPPAPTAEDVLRELPMVHVRTNSRGQAEISVRGSESRQVAVLLDGVPLTLGWDARTDVSVLPAGAAREINFVRGLSSILHGPNVLGGVVEMNIAGGSNLPTGTSRSIASQFDNAGGYSAAGEYTAPFETTYGRGLIRFGGGYRDSPGATLAGGVSEPVPTDDDLRLNTDVSNLDGFVGLRYLADAGPWVGFSLASHRAERGIAAELGSEVPRLWRYPHISRTIVALSGGTGDQSTPWGVGDLEASLGIDFGRTEIESFTTRDYDVVDGFEEGQDRTVTLRLLGDHTLGSRGQLRSAFTFANVAHDETVDREAREFSQNLFSLGAESIWNLLDERTGPFSAIRVSFGGAYDRSTTPETGGLESLGAVSDVGGRLGLSALVNDGSTMWHAGISRRGRFPSLRETYSEALNRFVPNPDLMAEHLLAFESGITTRLGRGDLQIVGFHQRLTDAIRRITLEDGRRQRVNSERLVSTGVELLASQTFGDVAVGMDLTLQTVELTDPATTISVEPENLPGQLGSAYVRFPVGRGITAQAEAEYTGSQFCQDLDTGADVRLDGGAWFNGLVTRIWSLASGQRLETSVSVDNLANTALYDQCGLPRPGRLMRFSLKLF